MKRQRNMTFDQVRARKDKAARFLRNVLQDDERADQVASESVEDYAARRHFVLKDKNPSTKNPRCEVSPIIHERKGVSKMPAKREKLQDVLDDRDELLDKLEGVRDELDDILGEYDGDDDDTDDDTDVGDTDGEGD